MGKILPLLPPDCDLTDFGYMPLDVRRLRDSKLASHVSSEEFRAAVLLWCAAWHQVPAGSLPDNDIELAALASYGRVISEWRKHREGALHGFIKCTDGRLWHPVVASKAAEAWNQKRERIWSRECERIRKENKQRVEQGREPLVPPARPCRISSQLPAGIPAEDEAFPAESSVSSAGKRAKEDRKPPDIRPTVIDFPTESQHAVAGIPAENALKGKGKGKGTEGKEEKQAAVRTLNPREAVNGQDPLNCVENGQEIVGGFIFTEVWPRILAAAGINAASWMGTEIEARRWLREGIDPATIIGALTRVSERRDYQPPRTLAYFDRPVREAHARKSA